jgi:hypothetical protein
LFGWRALIVQVPNEPQGRRKRVPDAERDRPYVAYVRVRQTAVERSLRIRVSPVTNTRSGFLARVERLP